MKAVEQRREREPNPEKTAAGRVTDSSRGYP